MAFTIIDDRTNRMITRAYTLTALLKWCNATNREITCVVGNDVYVSRKESASA